MSLSVREMRKADSASWAEMRYRMWDSLSTDEHMTDIARMLSRETKRTGYIAVADGNLSIGFAEVSIRDYANSCTRQPVPFLEGIWVDPDYHKRGIGRMLVTAIERDLINEGFQELCSDADIENTISHHAHGTWGFGETERVVYFRKSLIGLT